MKVTEGKKIYFASDNHLGIPDSRSSLIREKKFVKWLDTIKVDAHSIYLLGDLLTMVLALVALYWSMHPIFTSLEFGSVTHGLRISQVWFTLAVPLGFLLVVFRLIQSIKRDFQDLLLKREVFKGNKLFD